MENQLKIKRISGFKNVSLDKDWFNNWVAKLEKLNNKTYDRILVQTSLGATVIFGLNTNNDNLPAIVIFPGARTTSLFWDFDDALKIFEDKFRIFLVEANGLPNLSDGRTPDIKSLDYGYWASEILDQLNIKKAFIAGASFGGLICMKLAIVNPSKIEAAFLLNPGCLQPFSISSKNLYYNLLPIIFPKRRNVSSFLDNAIFCKPNHTLPKNFEDLLIDYELFALKRFKDRTQKPYSMDEELSNVRTKTYLIVGDKDLLFPYEKSISKAKKYITILKEILVFKDVGHGIETYKPAINKIADLINKFN